MPIQRAFNKNLDARWVKLKRALPVAVATQLNPVNMVGGDAVRAFQSWIDAALNNLVLGSNGAWTLTYVRQAGDAALLRAGMLARTIAKVSDRVPTLQTLAITELQGITEAVSQQAVRTLANGLLTKQPPNKIARLIQQVIDKTGIDRGHLLTSFITMRAFGAVTLDSFRASGITHVGTVAERVRPSNSPLPVGLTRDAKKKKKSPFSKFKGLEVVEVLTAGDDDVCPVCEEISENGPYDLDEAEMLIPAHIRCRCAFVPAHDARFSSVHDYDPSEDRDGHGRWTAGGAERDKLELQASQIVLYHGTSRSLLKSIKQHGLVPSGLQQKELGAKARGGDAWAAKEGMDVHKFTVGDRALSVYMTTNPDTAVQFSLTAADVNKSEPLILQLRIPREKIKDIFEDEYAEGMQAFRFKGKVTPDMIDRVAFTRQGKIDLASVNDAMSDLVLYAVAFVDGHETALDFNPDESRDDHGRWAMGGNTVAQDLAALHSDGTETLADVDRQLTPAQRHETQKAWEELRGKTPTNVKFLGPDGKYTPERVALHAEIIDNMFSPEDIAHAIPKPGQRPVLTITGGRPAAGKTSTLKGELSDTDKHSFYISADTIQEYLPGYDGRHAGLFNGEAQDIALQVEKIAMDNRLNVTYDATMKSQQPAIERVQKYKDAGYDVHGYFVHTSPVTSAVRSVQRFMDTGRFVPPAIAFNSRTNEKTFDALIPKLDKWAIYDNNGEKPRLVARGKKNA